MTNKPCKLDALKIVLDEISNAIASYDDPDVSSNPETQDNIQYVVGILAVVEELKWLIYYFMQIDSNFVKDSFIWCQEYLESMLEIESSYQLVLTTTCTANFVCFETFDPSPC
jgi:hypothetical protein